MNALRTNFFRYVLNKCSGSVFGGKVKKNLQYTQEKKKKYNPNAEILLVFRHFGILPKWQ